MRIPEPDEIQRVAQQLGLAPTPEEVAAFREGLAFWGPLLESLTEFAEDRPPLRRTVRDPGYRPGPDEDPYHCFITKCFVKGSGQGPLKGKRIGVKDSVCVAGVPMTLGSRLFEGYIPDVDATVVTRLLDAGADIVGKLNMDTFAHGSHGLGTGIGDYPRVKNPHNPEHLSGGSSSGSAAAVAAGLVDLAVGGDQGGSIRHPASWCGVIGHKPTRGLVPHTGIVGLEPSIDYAGPMGRRVEDVVCMLECMAGPDGFDPRQVDVPDPEPYADILSEDVAGVRIGILREGFGQEGAEPDVDEAVRTAVEVLRKKGAKVAEVSVPEHLTLGGKVAAALVLCGSWLTSLTCGSQLLQGYHHTQFTSVFGKLLASQADRLPPRMKFTRLLGALLGPEAFALHGRAHNLARTLRRAYDAVFAEVDCLVMPTTPMKAPRYEPPRDRREALSRAIARKRGVPVTRNVAPFNASGHPALSLPCGLRDGLPVGMMLVGRHFADGLLLRIAYAYQQSVDWDRYFIVPV